MKKHTKIYCDVFGYDFHVCEICRGAGVDVHHIDEKGMGGDPQEKKDVIENLICLCRSCHDRAHGIKLPKIERQTLIDKHVQNLYCVNTRQMRRFT